MPLSISRTINGKIRIFCIFIVMFVLVIAVVLATDPDRYGCDKASELDIYHIQPSSAPIYYTYNKCVGLNYS
jgi:ABC-type cobalt transport system substrate-binding protein